MTPDNSHLARHRLERARDALKEAYMLFEKDLVRGTVNRSYYAMFYAASALLATKYLAFKTHHGVISSFQKEFVKTGKLPKNLGKWLQRAFDMRGSSDYQDFTTVEKSEAKELLENANVFVAEIREVLNKEMKD